MREWLRKIRENNKITQEEVANKCKISRVFYTQIENKKRTPSVQTAKKLAEILGFDWTRFYDNTPENGYETE